MAEKGVIGCALSMDCYHDPISADVIDAFTREHAGCQYTENVDSREIRDVTGKEINAGRCDFGETGCPCPGIIIRPDGIIKACGCDGAITLGTVYNPDIPEDWSIYDCQYEQEYYKIEGGKYVRV
jgi:hypothetical protein